MSNAVLINKAKLAMGITTNAFNDRISDLIEAAYLDMGVAGVEVPEGSDSLVSQAAITYVQMHFGQPDERDWLKKSYDEQKAQLVTCTGYTDWLGVE